MSLAPGATSRAASVLGVLAALGTGACSYDCIRDPTTPAFAVTVVDATDGHELCDATVGYTSGGPTTSSNRYCWYLLRFSSSPTVRVTIFAERDGYVRGTVDVDQYATQDRCGAWNEVPVTIALERVP